MNDFMICPFCHSPVTAVKFDGGWKCECVRCEYTSRDGETMQEAIEFHQELADLESKNASLRVLVKELLDLIKSVNDVEYVDVCAWFEGCVDDEQQEWLYSAMDAIHKCQMSFKGLADKAREVAK